jgi:hypothetical protein
MNRAHLVLRILIPALALIVPLVSSSCDSGTGVGAGVAYPTRWGGGNTGPSVFVGGPSY